MATTDSTTSINEANERDPFNNNTYGTLIDKEFVQVECQRVVGVLAGQLLDFRRWELVVIFESGVPAFERRRNAKPTGTSPDYYYAVVLQVVIAPSTAS